MILQHVVTLRVLIPIPIQFQSNSNPSSNFNFNFNYSVLSITTCALYGVSCRR